MSDIEKLHHWIQMCEAANHWGLAADLRAVLRGLVVNLTTRDGREVEVTVMGESDDVQIDKAKYDDGTDVPDDVVEQLMEDHGDALYEAWLERARDHAEAYADSREDR